MCRLNLITWQLLIDRVLEKAHFLETVAKKDMTISEKIGGREVFLNRQQLQQQVDFDNAVFTGVPISVWRGNQHIDFGGRMTKHDDVAAYIEGGYFLKSEFRFVVRLEG